MKDPNEQENDLLTSKEAAHYLRLSCTSLRMDRYRGTYGFPYVKVGNCIRYKKSHLKDFIKNLEDIFPVKKKKGK